jgi:hypothetical protein
LKKLSNNLSHFLKQIFISKRALLFLTFNTKQSMKKISFITVLISLSKTNAQEYFSINESVKNKSEIPMAYTNATIQIAIQTSYKCNFSNSKW